MTLQENQPLGILEQMMDARLTCRELLVLLSEENHNIGHNKVEELETRLNMKKRLTLRLERLIQDIKATRENWKADRQAGDLALRLAEEIQVFQQLASKNLNLLKAAHQVRADIVAVIRDTIEATQPRMSGYSKSGAAYTGSAGTRVVSREI